MNTPMRLNAAEHLVGVELPGGWQVTERVAREIGDTGGFFSVNYRVVNADGRRGFCKVLNYYWILSAQSPDPVEPMAEATNLYRFERDLAHACAHLSRVVTALDDGTIYLDGFTYSTVSYIIFEAAERDIRGLLNTSDFLDVAVRLRSLHHLATAISQLHGQNIAHQDIKPSNLLVFSPDVEGKRHSKLGDLGRATKLGTPMAHDDYPIAGDGKYAPPEGLYGAVPEDFRARRFGSDLYQLGGMITFIFSSSTMNAQLASELDPRYHWTNWRGTFAEALPYLQDAFARSLHTIGESIPDVIRPEILTLIEDLCEPDPRHRGDRRRKAQWSNPYSLERIITRLDLLCRRAEVRLRSAT